MEDENRTQTEHLREMTRPWPQVAVPEAQASKWEQTEQERQLFKAIAESSTEAIAVSDPAGGLVYVNPAYERLFGRSLEEARALEYRDNYLPASAAILDREVAAAMDQGKRWEGELEVYGSHGRAIAIWQRTETVRGHDNKLRFRFDFMHEITRRKRAESALLEQSQNLKERLKELNCLLEISQLLEKPNVSIEHIIQGIVDMIPAAMRYPEKTGVRVVLNHQLFTTANFRETPWTHRCKILVDSDEIGTLDVFYLKEKLETDGPPFLIEEQRLLKAIAEQMAKIIDRKKIVKALRESESKYRLLVENANEGILVAQDGMLKFVNAKLTQILGYSEKELTSRPFTEFVYREDRKMVFEHHLKRLRGEEEPAVYNLRIVDRKGNIRWLMNNGVIIQWEDRPATLNFMSDITDVKLAEEQIRTLSHQMIEAQESERQMISRELHDRVAQDLFALKIASQAFFDDYPPVLPEMKQKVAEFATILDRAISIVRDLTYDLRPPGLEDLGLIQALSMYCEEFSEKSGLKIDFSVAGIANLALDKTAEINIYRLVQEGLSNIRKHADATQTRVKLVGSYPNIILRIEDNGKGFDVAERARAAGTEKRMGLRSMAERVNLLRGKMSIQSSPMQGTRIFISIPGWLTQDDTEKNHSDRR